MIGPEQDMMTVKQVAQSLGVSVSKVYQLVSRAELPSYAIGTAIRIQSRDVGEYLKSRRRDPMKIPQSSNRHF